MSKGKLDAAAAAAIEGRIKGTTDLLAALWEADLVVEAVAEVLKLKKEVHAELDRVCKPDAILCSNTSGISITEMASATKRPGKFIGMHFFNPVPVMKLVELTRGFVTSDETFAITKAFVEKVGKTPSK